MSTSDATASMSAPQTSSAASSVQPPPKTARLSEQLLLAPVEQVVTPRDRRAQRPLAFGRRSRAAGEQRQPLVEPREQRRRRECLDAGCGKFDRERQAVEPSADLRDLAVRRDVGMDRGGALRRTARRPRARCSGSTGTSHSPSRCSGSRLVTSTVRFGDTLTSARRRRAAASSRCSKLSSRSSSRWSPTAAASVVLRARVPASPRSRRAA